MTTARTVEAAIARAFDGRFWQTVLMGEASFWVRDGSMFAALRTTPMQLGRGDVLTDNEAQLEWIAGRSVVTTSLGVRLGEALRGTTGWGGVTLSWPMLFDTWGNAERRQLSR